jgi:hypothetical protein
MSRCSKLIVSVLVLTACGSSSKGTPDARPAVPDAPVVPDARPTPDSAPIVVDAAPPADAPPPDFSCIGAPPATSAPNPVHIQGVVTDGANSSPIVGANLDFLMTDESTIIASTQTKALGVFSLSLPTGGNPLPGVGKLTDTANSYVDFWLYPAEPLFQDLPRVPAVMLTPTELTLAAIIYFSPASYDDTKGLFVVQVVDCSNRPLAGATVTLTPSSGVGAYAATDGTPDTSLSATTAEGLYEVMNADPATPITVTGSIDPGTGPIALHGAASVPVHAGAITATIIHP